MTCDFEDVRRAADALAAEGKDPSVREVAARLGGGSHSTVGPLLALWKGRQESLAAGDLPERYLEDARVLAVHLWQCAQQQLGLQNQILIREIAGRTEQFNARESGLEAERNQLPTRVSELEAQVQDLRGKLAQKSADVDAATHAAGTAGEQRDALARKLRSTEDDARAEAVAHRAELADLRYDLTLAREQTAQIRERTEGLTARAQAADERAAGTFTRYDALLQRVMEGVEARGAAIPANERTRDASEANAIETREPPPK